MCAAWVVLWWAHHRSLASLSGRRQAWLLAVRTLLLTCLILALAGSMAGIRSHRQHVLFLLDHSASIDAPARDQARRYVRQAAAAPPAGDRLEVQHFAASVSPVRALDQAADWTPPADWADRATALDAALRSAASLMDPGFGRRIVVCTDGVPTDGGPLDALQQAAEAGIAVDFVPLPAAAHPEVQVAEVSAPGAVHAGEPFFLRITARSNRETEAALTVYVNGILSHTQSVTVAEGEQAFALRQIAGEERLLRYRVDLQSADDRFVDNNTGSALVRTRGRPRALLIEDRVQDGRHLRWALEEEDIELEVRSARGMPRSLADLRNYDALVLSDIPSHRLTSEQMDIVRAYVRDFGGGFLMLGGEHSFGLGGYYKTAVEDVLPVRMDFERERETPSLAMVLVIDKSGSMGGLKIELAKEAAKAAAELLDVRDQLGVIAFDGQTRWVCEMHSAADRDYILDRISSLQSGGGTDMAPALAAAYSALEAVMAKLKHVIALTDGHSAPGNFYDLVTSMRSSGITVSTVGVGDGADTALLERIAAWGEGRYYFTADPLAMPQIFAKETITAAKSAIRETPFLAQPVRPHASVRGIDFETAPFLLGYVVTKPKATSEVILATERGDPLLAAWRYGLGRTAAFTSDAKNRWAAEWVEWEGFSPFWAQVFRSILRENELSAIRVTVQEQDGALQVAADFEPRDGEWLEAADQHLQATLLGPNLEAQEHALTQNAPGRFVATVDGAAEGDYHIQVTRRIGDQVTDRVDAAYVKGYPPELRLRPTDAQAMRAWAAMTGGRFDPAPEAVLGQDRLTGYRMVRLWPGLLTASLALLVLDVALRRVDFGPGQQSA